MVIVVKNYEWKETESTLTVTVPIKNVISTKADVFNSSRYIKLSFGKFLFEAILLRPTKIKDNKCTITENQVIFELFKCENALWGQLEPDLTNKQDKQKLKQSLIDEEHERFRKESQLKCDKRHELKRVAVQEQMSIETSERETIETVKNEEKRNAMGDVRKWAGKKETKVKKKAKKTTTTKQAVEEVIIKENNNREVVPEVREQRTVEISFTAREFPTPCRESRLEEENEWLKKQAQARRTAGFVSEDIRPEERNPQFLKRKGDDFMRSSNYLGAISAYSFGITLSANYVDLYVARSAAHFAIGNLHKSIQDCSTAMDLMKPEVASNLNERAECIARRGLALCKIGMIKQGISEIKASLRLKTNDEYIQQLKQFEDELAKKLDEQSD